MATVDTMRSFSSVRLLLVTSMALTAALGQSAPWQQLQDPAAAGWNVDGLRAAREAAERHGSAATMAAHGGRVVLAWGDIERRYECHSVRKSILSAMYGIAVEQGLVDPKASLDALGIDDLEPLSDVEKSACIADLLAARSGIYHPAAKEPSDMKRGRPPRHSKKPGEAFHYNNWDFNVLGVILGQGAKRDLFALFEEWLAKPLGLEDFEAGDATYELEPSNSRHPAYAFRLSARDLLRFGQLYARNGKWGDRQVIPERWVATSTAVVSQFENGRGYGYMWWVYPAGSMRSLPSLDRHDLIAAIGTGGQLLLVVPAADFVFVHRGDTDNDRLVSGGEVWKIAEQVFAARPASLVADAPTRALSAIPLPGALPEPARRKPIAVAAVTCQELVGEYEVERFGRFRVFLHEGRLFVHTPMDTDAEMFCEAADHYFLRSQNVTMRVARKEDGTIDRFDFVMGGRAMRGRRVD